MSEKIKETAAANVSVTFWLSILFEMVAWRFFHSCHDLWG
jgi:hypothetical protein